MTSGRISHGPLHISRWLLNAVGTRLFLYYENRIPQDASILVVSNHRSFMDAPLLMAALNRSIRFACHHYMSQVPILREMVVGQLGCFPLASMEYRQRSFLQQASYLLQTKQPVGVFPEGAGPMIHLTQPNEVVEFHRGFAHLALRAPVKDLVVLPVAIAATTEEVNSAFPVRLLSLFDPSEPEFKQEGWHPMVIYKRVNVLVGQPFWVTSKLREYYQGKDAKLAVQELTQYCQTEIGKLLIEGCY